MFGLERRYVIATCVILGLVILFKTPFLDVVFAFLLAGIIPGTRLVIPAAIMFIGYILLGLYIVHRLFRLESKPVKKRAKPAVKKSTRRRYSKA